MEVMRLHSHRQQCIEMNRILNLAMNTSSTQQCNHTIANKHTLQQIETQSK